MYPHYEADLEASTQLGTIQYPILWVNVVAAKPKDWVDGASIR